MSQYPSSEVVVLDSAGGTLEHWDGGAVDRELRFEQPLGIAVHPDTGIVFIADTDEHRIQAFDLSGVLAR